MRRFIPILILALIIAGLVGLYKYREACNADGHFTLGTVLPHCERK